MPRPGVTFEDVCRVAAEISSHGLQPTIERVRAALEGGSHTTIHRHLQAWRRAQQQGGTAAVPDAILGLVQQISAGLQATAEARVAEEQKVCEQAVGELEVALLEVQGQRDQAQAELTQLRTTLEEVRAAHAAEQEHAEEARQRATQFQTALQASEEVVVQLRADLQVSGETHRRVQEALRKEGKQALEEQRLAHRDSITGVEALRKEDRTALIQERQRCEQLISTLEAHRQDTVKERTRNESLQKSLLEERQRHEVSLEAERKRIDQLLLRLKAAPRSAPKKRARA